MSENIFVPIKSTPAINMIPENQDIIYSTMCKHQYVVKSALVAPSMSGHLSFETHVLMTKSGFVYKVRKTADEYEFVPWTKIRQVREKELIFSGNHRLTLIIDKVYEDKYSFKQRVKNFRLVIIPYIIECLQSKLSVSSGDGILSNRMIKKMGNTIAQLEKIHKKLS